MPKHRGLDGPPHSYVVAGEWPDGKLDGQVLAEYVRQVAVRLDEAIGGRSVRDVAREADLQHTTVLGLLKGESWPDLVTIAKLEQELGVRLWPDDLAC